MIFSYTQSAFVQFIYDRLGKGKRHAALLYAQWFKTGQIDPSGWAEPQAMPLIEEMHSVVPASIGIKTDSLSSPSTNLSKNLTVPPSSLTPLIAGREKSVARPGQKQATRLGAP